MSPVTISCPKCRAGLKLPNREMLGRKGKCPNCKHRFILEEPDEVELQLAETETPAATVATPLVGTSPKWIPDNAQPSEPVFPVAPFPPMSASQPAVAAPDAESNAAAFNFDQSPATGSIPEPSLPSPPETDLVAAVPASAEEGSVASRVLGRKKRRNRTGPIVLGVGTALFVASMIGLWYRYDAAAKAEAAQAAAAEKPAANPAWEEQKIELADSNDDAKQLSPTSGKPIPLEYMPFTPHLILHLRPSEIWSQDRRNREFVATLGDLGTWLAQQIRDITRFEPQEIEELTFALNFGPRTSPPDVAAVVRLRSEQTISDLQLKRFRGQMRSDLDAQVFESDPWSYLLIDSKTFAVASILMSDSLAGAKSYSRAPSVDIEILHQDSDRERQMTLMFDLTNIDTHREFIFAKDMQQLADSFVLWFGKDVQTASWSFHLGADNLYMETLLHPNNESSPLKVQRHMRGQLQDLPSTLQKTTRFMNPGTVAYRSMIGRFPAMMKAVDLGTSSHVDAGYVRLVTILPDNAAANLAAASLLTWNQSIVTDFTVTVAVATTTEIPATVADRLKMPVLVDFRRTPLQEAFEYISDEIKTPIKINGDALKLSAMTNNMPQTYNLGEVSGIKAIDTIVSNPDYRGLLVIVVDEAAKTIQVTTRPVAEESGLPIYDTKK